MLSKQELLHYGNSLCSDIEKTSLEEMDMYMDISVSTYCYVKLLQSYYYKHPLVDYAYGVCDYHLEQFNIQSGYHFIMQEIEDGKRKMSDPVKNEVSIREVSNVFLDLPETMTDYMNHSHFWHYIELPYYLYDDESRLEELRIISNDYDDEDSGECPYELSDDMIFSLTKTDYDNYNQYGSSALPKEVNYIFEEVNNRIFQLDLEKKPYRHMLSYIVRFLWEQNSEIYYTNSLYMSILIPLYTSWFHSHSKSIDREDRELIRVLEKAIVIVQSPNRYTSNFVPAYHSNDSFSRSEIFAHSIIYGIGYDAEISLLSCNRDLPIACRLIDEIILYLNSKYDFLDREII